MSHSEKCRKRFESIEKEKLDKQLEEATRNAEPPSVIAAEMDVEDNRRLVEPRDLLYRRSLVRRRCRCQVPVLTKYGWRLLNRAAARDRWKVVMRVRANESGALLECFCLMKMTRLIGNILFMKHARPN